MESRLNLKNELVKSNCLVLFEKADGSMREMKCTTNPTTIPWPDNPVEDISTLKTERVPDENHFVVWDIEVKGWRSFKYDRVTTWEVI